MAHTERIELFALGMRAKVVRPWSLGYW